MHVLMATLNKNFDSLCKSSDDIHQRIVKDEYGVSYSEDGAWLLSAPKDLCGSYTIKEGTISICNNAFNDLQDIESIVFPSSLLCIGEHSFAECAKLSSIILPKNLLIIGKRAFSGLSSHHIRRDINTTYSSCLQYIGDYAFDWNDLRYFIIPSTVEHIGNNPFVNCVNICLISNSERFIVEEECLIDLKSERLICCQSSNANLVCGKNISIIGDSAVLGNNTLINVETSPSLRAIENEAFYKCVNLERVQLFDGLQSIGNAVFASCKKLSSIIIPDSVTIFGDAIFHGDVSLKSFTLGKQIKHIDCQTFCSCDGIEYFSTGSNPNYIYEEGCLYSKDFCTLVKCLLPDSSGSYTVKHGVKEIAAHAFCSYSFREVILPSTLNIIKESAFYGSDIETIIIPENVTELDIFAFEFTQHLSRITFLSKETKIMNVEKSASFFFSDIVLPEIREMIVPRESLDYYKQQFQEFLKSREQVSVSSLPEKESEKTEKECIELEEDEKKRLYVMSHTCKKDAGKFKQYLRDNGVKYLYHFTDKANLQSIKEMGGLFSWKYCVDHNINIQNSGGSDESRSLDSRYKLEDYVRLSFCDDHPMAYWINKRGADLVLLRINVDVAWLQGTLFSDVNATDTSHHHGHTLEDLMRVDFQATKQHYVSNEDPNFKKHQAEVLIKTFVPIEYIENINNPIPLFKERKGKDSIGTIGNNKNPDDLDNLPF